MTGVAIRHAWLQKHPTPIAAGGEFHWFPADGDKELRSELVDRARNLEPPAVLWMLAPGRAAWARAFAAHAPVDGRRYVGLAVAIAEAATTRPGRLLASIAAPPEPMPWYPTGAGELHEVDAIAPREIDRRDAIAIARSVIDGGQARLADPASPSLLATLAALEASMPRSVTATVRWGSCVGAARGDLPKRGRGQTALVAADPVAMLAVSAWLAPTSELGRAWRLLGELAELRARSVDAVARDIGGAAIEVLTDEERAVVSTGELVDVLHAWGRGRFDLCPTAGTLVARLADAVALRALAELASGRDASAAIAEARWHAVLPAARRETLLRAVVERACSLREVVEASHG